MWSIGCMAAAALNLIAGNVVLAIVLGCLVLARVMEDRMEVTP